jgi:hypothetical protein
MTKLLTTLFALALAVSAWAEIIPSERRTLRTPQ